MGIALLIAAVLPIINGNYAALGQFPTVVAVRTTTVCAGTLIAPDIVLTAAHCVQPASLGLTTQSEVTAMTRVTLDTIDVDAPNGRTIAASDTVAIESYRGNGDPDVGLVFLAEPVTDRAPTPVSLDPADTNIGTALTLVGFGKTLSGTTGQLLYTAPTSAVSCTEYRVNNALFVCVDQRNGAGICDGDGGGPAFEVVDGQLRVTGVASYGDDACAQFGAHVRTDAIVTRAFLHQYAPEIVPDDPHTTPPTPLIPDDDCNAGGGAGLGTALAMLALVSRRPRPGATR
jgi:secreted trypsin-like serine protease